MKHLHLQFIAASCGFGFGLFMLLLAAWQAQALNIAAPVSVRVFSPMADIFVAVVLMAFGIQGIRAEFKARR